MTDLIVLASGAFALAFTIAWALSPALRRWIERPKYRFLKDVHTCNDVQTYNQAHKAERRLR
jgi:hypothetical protein